VLLLSSVIDRQRGDIARSWALAVPGALNRHATQRDRDPERGTRHAAAAGTSTELSELDDAASKIQVQGGRYSEAAEQMTNL
jgi:hypothetical protein